MRVLVVEDSSRLRRFLCQALRRAGYAIDAAADGEEALALTASVDYDAIVLDVMLPRLDGLSVLDRLRREGCQARVLVLTARHTVEDRVAGLQRGADDYLVKPFALDELLARLQVLVRRRYDCLSPVVTFAGVSIDTARRSVTKNGLAIALRPREYALLEYLALRKGTLVSRAEIENHIYDDPAELVSNALDAAISRLRRKIDSPDAPSLVQTRRGMGYILDEDAT